MKKTNLTKRIFYNTFLAMVVNEISISVANVVDGFMVSHYLAYESMASWSLFAPANVIMALVAGLLCTGGQILCSKKLAKADIQGAKDIFNLVFWLSICSGVVVVFLALAFPKEIIFLLGGRPSMGKTYTDAQYYLLGLTLSMPAKIITISFIPFLHLDGARKRAATGVVLLMITDIILDLVVIFGFHGGMLGIALATGIASWVETSFDLMHFFKKNIMFRPVLRMPKFGYLKELLLLGRPEGIKKSTSVLKKIALNTLAGSVASSCGLASLGIMNNIKEFGDSWAVGMGSATLMIVGVYYNQENREEIRNLFRVALSSVKYAIALAIILVITAPFIARAFTSDESTINYTIFAIICYGVGMPVAAISNMYIDYLKGCGCIRLSNLFATLQRLVYIVLLAFILTAIFGIKGIFVAFSLAEILVFVTICIFVQVRNKKFIISIDDFLLLPDNFGVDEENQMYLEIRNESKVTETSAKVQKFCRSKSASDKLSYNMALFVEEACSNIINYGFKDETNYIDLWLAFKDDGNCVLMVRDNCKKFDPVAYSDFMKQYEDDISRNMGIKLLFGLADGIKYVNLLNLNILMVSLKYCIERR